LRYAHTTLNRNLLRSKIDKQDMYFSAIVGIDGAGAIENRDAVPHGEPRARSHLAFGAWREGHAEARWNEGTGAGRDHDRGIGRDRCQKVQPGRELALIGGQRQVGRVRQPHHLDIDLAHIHT
jgi:hypothetical protein